MLENVNLDRKLSREEFDRSLPVLQRRLYDLEKSCWDHGVPSIVIFEGWDAAGKGGCISTLTQRLDPRGFKLYATTAPRTYERAYPWLWRFWLKTPNRGEIVIFDHSWYRHVLDERIEEALPKKQWRQAYNDIVEFERMLADDGTVILKFFFHIDKKEQRARFRKMERDPLESWRIAKEDRRRHQRYSEYLQAAEDMFELTEREFAPWTIVEATNRRFAQKKVFDSVIAALERRLGADAPLTEPPQESIRHDADLRAAMDSLEQSREAE